MTKKRLSRESLSIIYVFKNSKLADSKCQTSGLGKWEWIEKYLKIKEETLRKQKRHIDRYGVWLALACWIPVIGDIFALALGFYKARPFLCIVLMLIGKFARFLAWNMIYGLF